MVKTFGVWIDRNLLKNTGFTLCRVTQLILTTSQVDSPTSMISKSSQLGSGMINNFVSMSMGIFSRLLLERMSLWTVLLYQKIKILIVEGIESTWGYSKERWRFVSNENQLLFLLLEGYSLLLRSLQTFLCVPNPEQMLSLGRTWLDKGKIRTSRCSSIMEERFWYSQISIFCTPACNTSVRHHSKMIKCKQTR